MAGRYGFRHALHQEVIYERRGAGRRVELHRRIGDRLEAGLGERAAEVATVLADQFARGRDARRAIRYLRLAADVATNRGAAREAVARPRATRTAQSQNSPRRRLTSLLTILSLRFAQGR